MHGKRPPPQHPSIDAAADGIVINIVIFRHSAPLREIYPYLSMEYTEKHGMGLCDNPGTAARMRTFVNHFLEHLCYSAKGVFFTGVPITQRGNRNVQLVRVSL